VWVFNLLLCEWVGFLNWACVCVWVFNVWVCVCLRYLMLRLCIVIL